VASGPEVVTQLGVPVEVAFRDVGHQSDHVRTVTVRELHADGQPNVLP
jgi:hypothetical protein